MEWGRRRERTFKGARTFTPCIASAFFAHEGIEYIHENAIECRRRSTYPPIEKR